MLKKPSDHQLPKIGLELWIVFQAVVEAGSFANAAAKLHKSQSTISYSINKLQDTLEVNLFEMTGRKAKLTPVGQSIYKQSLKLIDKLQQIETKIAYLSQKNDETLNIHINESFPYDLLIIALKKFQSLYPLTQVNMHQYGADTSVSDIKESNFELAITQKQMNSCSIELYKQQFYLYGHPSLANTQLIAHPSLSPPEHCCPEAISEYSYYANSLQLVSEFIITGLGIGWLPESFANKCPIELKKVNSDSLPTEFELPQFITCNKTLMTNETSLAFVNIISELC